MIARILPGRSRHSNRRSAACILSGIALSEAFDVFTRSIKFYISGLSETIETQAGDAVSNVLEIDKKQDLLKEKEKPSKKNKKKEKGIVEVEKTEKKRPLILPVDTSIFALFLIVLLATFYMVHTTIKLHLGGTTVTKQPQWLTGQS
ncbi:hypothetical protein L1887_36590 [Cichorium endivia]|nr:hypothetical protein L1887_36590 [Cichorium endivia]